MKKKVEKVKSNEPAGVGLKTIEVFKKDDLGVESRNYKPADKPIDDIIFDMDIGTDGVVDLDIETFFQKEEQHPSLMKKTTVKDPYSGKKAEPTAKENEKKT